MLSYIRSEILALIMLSYIRSAILALIMLSYIRSEILALVTYAQLCCAYFTLTHLWLLG